MRKKKRKRATNHQRTGQNFGIMPTLILTVIRMVRESDNRNIEFQLCKEQETYPIGEQYIYETKYDGERVKAIKKGDDVQLINRRYINKNSQYPEVVEELKGNEADFVIDGEIACADFKNGLNVLNRRALQTNELKVKLLVDKIPVKFFVFDVIEVNGRDVRNQELLTRKTILNSFVEENDHIELVEYWFNPEELWKMVEDNNLEGLIAKRKDSDYRFERNSNWIKVKLIKEAVVNCIGYKSDSKRSPFGSMITDKGNVSLLTEANKKFYFENYPKKALVSHFGIYPSGKMRNGRFQRWL